MTTDPLAFLLPQFMRFSTIDAAHFVFLLGLILTLGAIGARVFVALKIPQVVGYIVIGIFIGASGLQVLGGTAISSLSPISTVALALIGFLVGGELKIGVIRRYGRQFVGILLFESITPFFIVLAFVFLVSSAITGDTKTSFCLALILGSISAATAPAATTDVLKEYRTAGPVTTTVLGIVAMDDAVALLLYALSSTIASPLLEGREVSLLAQLACIAKNILGALAIGGITGFVLSYVIRNIMDDEGRILSFTLGALLLCTGVCVIEGFDNILSAMAFGFFMVNWAPNKTRAVFNLTQKFTPPIYVLFFVLVGAKLDIWCITPFVAIVALLYVLGRTFGKSLGAVVGAILTKAPESVRRYLPFCLLSQAGVAIGLSIAAGGDFAASIGGQILLIITATTFIVQLVGPICVKYGVSKAGECYMDLTLEDIKDKTRAKDVSYGGENATTRQKTIVNENTVLRDILNEFSRYPNLTYAVGNKEGKLCGIIGTQELKEALAIGEASECMLASDIMQPCHAICNINTSLRQVYNLFEKYDTEAVVMVDNENNLYGIVEKFESDHYLHTRVIELQRKVDKID